MRTQVVKDLLTDLLQVVRYRITCNANEIKRLVKSCSNKSDTVIR